MIIKYKLLSELAKPPTYMSQGAAGLDLFSALKTALVLRPGDRRVVPTGIALEIPAGYEGQIRPRSGWAMKWGITVLNAPGTVDSDYRGEVGVLLAHHGDQTLSIYPGDRIAQLVIAPVQHVQMELAFDLSDTGRGAVGFGSTGA